MIAINLDNMLEDPNFISFYMEEHARKRFAGWASEIMTHHAWRFSSIAEQYKISKDKAFIKQFEERQIALEKHLAELQEERIKYESLETSIKVL